MTRTYQLNLNDVYPLVLASETEGFRFVRRLYEDYGSGDNRFDSDGAALFTVQTGARMVAVGGLNQDPYVRAGRVGRVRRLYVHPDFRKMGFGRLLVEAIIQEARSSYDMLTLRTDNPVADQFYRKMGFLADDRYENTTHYLPL
ncbi:GNAT family N-acetyltransferase [Alicyclobacillus sp. SO9]|nr:GNAT family N-acetyltransferase [Alicyclobacillus sp. SO9]